eukprot:TRINITY_DN31186_c0_g1_i1.p1 TRINITY_DN31186_c0_g1~~TRINITY_DN31186_c0_g1_i1.p1  ORF type:complete len:192 (-),score=40.86 TRINITY_DN31186_c0_g1_i1:107-682(-)
MATRKPDRTGAVRHLTPAWQTRLAEGAADASLEAASLLAGLTLVDVTVSCSGSCGREDLNIAEFNKDELEGALARARATGLPRENWRLSGCCAACVAVAAEEASEAERLRQEQAREDKKRLLAEQGVSSFNEKEHGKLNESHRCWACQQSLPASAFSRKMLTKPPAKRRCQSCTEKALEEEASKRAAAEKR